MIFCDAAESHSEREIILKKSWEIQMMKSKFRVLVVPLLAAAFSLTLVSIVSATDFQLSGRVTDQSGSPLD